MSAGVELAPYYHDERAGITIYHGDALSILHQLDVVVDAVVMDPPYASGTRTEAAKPSSGSMLRGARFATPIENDQMTTTGFVWLIRETCFALRELMVDGASLFSFIDWRQWPSLVGAIESCNLRVNNMVVWDKVDYGMGWGFRAQHELIVHASKGTPRVVDHGIGNILRWKRDLETPHPSPKPVALIQQLLELSLKPGELVVDPYMGAGATLKAAKTLGMRAFGIEIKEQHCEEAARRLSQEVMAL